MTLTVKVLYFASVRELAGKSEESLTLSPDSAGAGAVTVRDLLRELSARVPGLAERLSFVRIARNEEFAREDERLADGDVIALLPPVAGG